MAKVTIFRETCKGVESCGICSFVCPKDLFCPSGEMNKAGFLPPELDNEAECTACENCMVYCPDLAIVVEKKSEIPSDKEEVLDG